MSDAPRIKSYNEGKADAAKELKDWIEAHRSYTELEAGIGVYRDHFTSNDLIAFIDSGKFK